MTNQIDPQVASAAVTGSFGFVTALIGAVAGFWRGGRARRAQDQRCELICTSMVECFAMFLTAFEGDQNATPQRVTAIAAARQKIEEARNFLNGTGA
jgi:hypothetical protein